MTADGMAFCVWAAYATKVTGVGTANNW